MKKYYDFGSATASIEETPTGKFYLVIIEGKSKRDRFFTSELDALRELLSCAEVIGDWFEEREKEARWSTWK